LPQAGEKGQTPQFRGIYIEAINEHGKKEETEVKSLLIALCFCIVAAPAAAQFKNEQCTLYILTSIENPNQGNAYGAGWLLCSSQDTSPALKVAWYSDDVRLFAVTEELGGVYSAQVVKINKYLKVKGRSIGEKSQTHRITYDPAGSWVTFEEMLDDIKRVAPSFKFRRF
jgi:hypothetical protein